MDGREGELTDLIMDIEFIAIKTALLADLTASSRVTKSFSSSLSVSISVHEKKG